MAAQQGQEPQSAAAWAEAAPAPQAMARVQPLTPELLPALLPIQNEFLGTKHCLCCIPLSETRGEIAHRYKTAERRALSAVALSGEGTPIGYVNMSATGVHRDACEAIFHALSPDEVYIETLAVRSGFRGQGAGRKLLEWAEDTARQRGARVLTLGVINGNPARRLYERFGFVEKHADPCSAACTCCLLACMFGQPYGCCPPKFGGILMEKQLA